MTKIKKYYIYPAVVLCTLSFCGCREKNNSPVLARVGNSVLTVDDLYRSIPPEYSDQITREQNVNYVKQWIDTELLYREALRCKLDKDKEIKDRLEKMKKDLLAAEMISKTSSHSSRIDPDDVRAFYEQNKSEMLRESDVVKYLEIVVDSLETATFIARSASESNFSSLAVQYSKIPFSDSGAYVPLEDLQPELRKAIETRKAPHISGPIKSELGYHVILVQEKLEKGGICTVEEAWEDIVTLLSSKAQKENIEKLLSDLRLKNSVEFNFDQISGNPSENSVINGK